MKKLFCTLTALACALSTMTALAVGHQPAVRKSVTVVVPTGEAVDLGLPSGLKWSSMNLGAAHALESGDRFAWGETSGYGTQSAHQFDSIDYSLPLGRQLPLKLGEDAAHALWGRFWRMPSEEEWNELNSCCLQSMETTESVTCVRFTSRVNNRSIVFVLTDDAVLGQQALGLWLNGSGSPCPPLEEYYSPTSNTVSHNHKAWYGMFVRPVYDDRPIDLGLPGGTLWMPANVGATAPEDKGRYFAWGDTLGHLLSEGHSFSEQSLHCTDNCQRLPLLRDAAFMQQSPGCEMPTLKQWNELLARTIHRLDTINNVPVYCFTSTYNGRSIYFPAAGQVNSSGMVQATDSAFLWLTTNSNHDTVTADCGVLSPLNRDNMQLWRTWGRSVRAVVRTRSTLRIVPDEVTMVENGVCLLKYESINDQLRVSWASLDNAVATVSATGILRAVAAGETRVTATGSDGSSDTIHVSVHRVETIDSMQVVLEVHQMTMHVVDTISLACLISPIDAPTELDWSSSDELVATVNNGIVAGFYPGTCIIYARSRAYPSVCDSCLVTVTYNPMHVTVDSMRIAPLTESLRVGSTRALQLTVYPRAALQAALWSSLDPDIASVNTKGHVTGLRIGTARIVARAMDESGQADTLRVTVIAGAPTPAFGQMVDMGLSVMWATTNLGAQNPYESGDCYAWGEVGRKDTCTWINYSMAGCSEHVLTAYNTSSDYGKTDGLRVLMPKDDAAQTALGGLWRMPTREEFAELLDTARCTATYIPAGNTEYGGVAGYRIVSLSNGNSIFLPVTLHTGAAGVEAARGTGEYWSSSLNINTPCFGWTLNFDALRIDAGYDYRSGGHPIRPVADYK